MHQETHAKMRPISDKIKLGLFNAPLIYTSCTNSLQYLRKFQILFFLKSRLYIMLEFSFIYTTSIHKSQLNLLYPKKDMRIFSSNCGLF